MERRQFLTNLGLSTALVANNTLVPVLQSKDNSAENLPDDILITDVKTYELERAILVKVETNAGISGWGEASSNGIPLIKAMIHDKLKKIVIGQSPFNVELLWDRMFWMEHDYGPSGVLPYAIAGIDLALWDFKGKLLKQPLYQLLGGAYRKEMSAYAGIPLYNGLVSVEETIDRAQKLVALGFKTIKLRMQIREYNMDPIPDPTIKYYTAVRKALPDGIEVFVDPNEGYTAARAVQVGRELERLGMKYFEGPCPLENARDTAEVVKALDIPVLAGEKCYTRWQFRDLILEANPDMIQPDPIKAGGITEFKKIATLGQAFFKPIVPHNTKPTLGTAATLHLMASISNAGPFIEFVELDTYQEVLSVFEQKVTLIDGKLQVPEGHGLGLAIDEQKLLKIAR
jgi:L-alanine-DL-glutamate epimerase-like enolase superfamily enzyme